MIGGAGNDVYIVDSLGDTITEAANAGTDEVETALASYSLAGIANLENLIGTALGGQTLTGNALDNVIAGNGGNDTLDGGAGNDTLIGGTGDDTMSGGLGDDIIVGGAGADALTGGPGNDTYVVDNVGDVVVGTRRPGHRIVQSSIELHARGRCREPDPDRRAGIDGTGDGDANSSPATAPRIPCRSRRQRTLDGGVGADTMLGGLGNDMYFVDNASDVWSENVGEGTDTVFSTAHYGSRRTWKTWSCKAAPICRATATASQHAQRQRRQQSPRRRRRRRHHARRRSATTCTSSTMPAKRDREPRRGQRTVFSTAHFRLSANVETWSSKATPTCRATAKLPILGNAGNNILNGGAGADAMVGGAGNDIYFVDNASDAVFENPGEGTDAVFSTAHFRLTANVETLVLQGSANLQGYGKAGANTLYGNSGNNLLNGEGGADRMVGGAGNDTYFVDNIGDIVLETLNEGTDAVFSTIDYTLTANVETWCCRESAT